MFSVWSIGSTRVDGDPHPTTTPLSSDRDLPGFQDAQLDDSFLDERDDRTAFDVSLALLPEHPRHQLPKEGEAGWWEPASIVFTNVQSREWTRLTGMVFSVPDGSEDLGRSTRFTSRAFATGWSGPT